MNGNILVVDDDQDLRDVITDLLETQGYFVVTATDGYDALEKLSKTSFDLFIIDLSMPKMDGIKLLAEIKKIHPAAVIIVLTGYSSIEGAVNAINFGAYHYISKPIKAAPLFNLVRKAIDYSYELSESNNKQTRPGYYSSLPTRPSVLFGFKKDEIDEFYKIGKKKTYEASEVITLSEKHDGSFIIIDSGEISVSMSGSNFDYLKKYDSWGEENIILESSMPVDLIAESKVVLHIFERRGILSFFSTKEDLLWKRFIINMSNQVFLKWRKTIQRLVMLKMITQED